MATALKQEKGRFEKSTIGIDKEIASALIPQLDAHLSSLFVLFHQYQKHYWLVEGPQYRDLHTFIRECYSEIHRHIDLVAERIVALGGVPTSDPVEQIKLSYVTHEPEGAFGLRTMLSLDNEYDQEIARHLRETVVSATELGDIGTSHLLKEILVDTEARAHHLDSFLGADHVEDCVRD